MVTKTARPRLAALRSTNFRNLWLGLIVSNAGSQMQTAALFWLVLELTDSTVALGLVSLSFALPMIVLPFFGGTVADRYDRVTVLKLSRVASMLVAFLLAGLTLTGVIQYWQILALNFLNATLLAIDNPARQALLPDLVPPPDLISATSLNSAAFTGAALFGPALGGFLLVLIGPAGVFLVNGVSFLAVLSALFLLRGIPDHRRATGAWWRNVAEGLRYVWSDRLVLGLVLLSSSLSFFGNARAFQPLMPVFARDRLMVGEIGYGFLLAAAGAGSLIGAFGLAAVGDFRARDRALAVGVALAGLTLIAFGLTVFYPAVLGLLVLNGVCSTGSAALIATSLQLRTPQHLRGRVMSLYAITVIGIGSLSGLAVGALAAQIPPISVVLLWGVIAAALGLTITRGLREVRNLGHPRYLRFRPR